MRNLKLILAYDGSEYAGWQVQPDRETIQGTLASAIGRLTGENVLPQGSGRTDAGVHALAQVATFGTESVIPVENFRRALNSILPLAIRVMDVREVPVEFHARKSARGKTYRYRIYRGEVCSPFVARYVWHYPYPLDEAAMIRAAAEVVGERDFTSFAAVDEERKAFNRKGREGNPREDREEEQKSFNHQGHEGSEGAVGAASNIVASNIAASNTAADSEVPASNVRRIFVSSWERAGEELIYTVRGNGFLHHMVRNLVGTFLLVGKATLAVEDIGRILEARSRSAAGATAPAGGLCLMGVEYE